MQKRADILLVEKGLMESRAKAQAAISAGHVRVAGEPVRKAGLRLPVETAFEITAETMPWVSRAGIKLARGLEAFPVSLEGCVVLDLGASTGGFTQVALAHGASHVFALDVGHDQLHVSLRDDPRVTMMEGVNARAISGKDFERPISAIVCDLSFISLRLALPPALDLTEPGAVLICLIKPQFEAGKEHVGRGGLVKDPEVHARVIDEVRTMIAATAGWNVIGICDSPITGGDGNKEFLIAARKEN